MCNVTHFLLVKGKDVMNHKTVQKMCNVTDILFVIGQNAMGVFSGNVQCHSLSIGHRTRCEETAFPQNGQ
jgi:hypothetical protein